MQALPSKLPEHKVVPFWTLPDSEGQTFNLAKQRGRAHFILLVCGPAQDPEPFLQQLAPHMPALQALPAQGLVVIASTDQAARLVSLPFTVLIDESHKVQERYLSTDASAGLFMLDRYGALYHQWLVADVVNLPSASDVVDWITAVSMQCSV
jgi:peroxiredoxin